MAEQYTIRGKIIPLDHLEAAGIRVSAIDRDLPSLERRIGYPPVLLGETVSDAEGRFQITYTVEPFDAGEGILLLQRVREKHADISFHVLDRTGQELRIRGIEALGRSYHGDEIIFNAPAELEVAIYIETSEPENGSEYERFVALLAPILADVPPAELTDEDITFLIGELGDEQQLEIAQRIHWLWRSALLAAAADTPTEAFYGWGRKDLPAAFGELSQVPISRLESVWRHLLAEPDSRLREALLAAIENGIIPRRLREEVADIVRRFRRQTEVLHQATAQLQDAVTGLALAGYNILTVDLSNENEELGLDITDTDGGFAFHYYVSRDLSPEAPPRLFSFRVMTAEGYLLTESEQVSIDPGRAESERIIIKVRLPGPTTSSLEEQLNEAQTEASPALLEWLRGQGIHALSDIRRRGGLTGSDGLQGFDPAQIQMLDSLADLDRVSSSTKISKELIDKGYGSVLDIALAPYSEFLARIASHEQEGLSQLETAKLHVMATVQTNLLNNLLTAIATDTANGFNLLNQTGNAGGNP